MKKFFYHAGSLLTLFVFNFFLLYPAKTYFQIDTNLFTVGWFGSIFIGVGVLYPIQAFWSKVLFKK